jgi:ribosomal protein S18 acetylase RimI-like enzyme
MMQEIKITPPRDTDGAAIVALAGQIELFSAEDVDTVRELWEESLHSTSDPDRYHFLAALAGETLVGFSCYGHRPLTAGSYDLYWIAVDPNVQNLGIGKALLGFVERTVAEHKGRMVIIETSSQPKYEPTRQFYLRNGYELEARVRGFYKPGDDRLIFVKTLIPEKGGS